MPYYFWAEAVATTVYIMNRTPIATVHGMMLKEKYIGRKPNISHLKSIWLHCLCSYPNERRTKLDPKAETCIFIGYSMKQQKGYHYYNSSTHRMQVRRDVIIDEMSC